MDPDTRRRSTKYQHGIQRQLRHHPHDPHTGMTRHGAAKTVRSRPPAGGSLTAGPGPERPDPRHPPAGRVLVRTRTPWESVPRPPLKGRTRSRPLARYRPKRKIRGGGHHISSPGRIISPQRAGRKDPSHTRRQAPDRPHGTIAVAVMYITTPCLAHMG